MENKLGKLRLSLLFHFYSSDCTDKLTTTRSKYPRSHENNNNDKEKQSCQQKKQVPRSPDILCRVLGSMRWMVLVTRMHTQIWLMLPRLCASFGDRHTTLSCTQTERNSHSHFLSF